MLHRHARLAVAGSFLRGALAGAFVTAAVLTVGAGLLSPLPLRWRATAALCGLVLLGLHQARVLCLDLPQREWQIPQDTFHDDPRRAAARFAFVLGTGVRTYITTAAPYGLGLVLLLGLEQGWTALIGSAFAAIGYGLGRSVIVVTQVARAHVAVDHPQHWLTAASWISLAALASVVGRAFGI